MSANLTQARFETMVRNAEALARQSPARYKLGIIFYTLLGYLFILGVLCLLFGITGLIVGSAFLSTALFLILLQKKLLFVLAPSIWILLKALWVRVDPPAGYTIRLKDFPLLQHEIRELQDRLKSPRVHQVLLTPEFNAAVVQTPRLGVLGWHKNTLILGLELLLSLSPEQARAVLAHEFGHLSGNHSRFKAWIYRVRTTWDRVTQAYAGIDSWGARMMFRFFNWYSPRFSAYTFPLARMNEYEADAVAAQITSPQILTEALVNTCVTSDHAGKEYWAFYFRKADLLPEPDHMPWQGLTRFMNEHRLSGERYTDRLQAELERATAYYDTHPSLKDRAAALNVTPRAPSPVQRTAAGAWLGERLQQVIADFDNQWMQANRDKWRERYQYVSAGRKRLAELEGRPLETLSDDELWSKASLSEELIDEATALPLYRAIQSRHPRNSSAAYAIGRLLYNRGDETCLEQLKIALANPRLALDACRCAYRFLEERARMDEADWWEQRFEEQTRILEASRRERSLLNLDDPLEKAGLPAAAMAAIANALRSADNVKHVWVAQKKLKHFPEFPAFAFVVEIDRFVMDEDKRALEIIQAANIRLDGDFFVVSRSGPCSELAVRIIQAGEQVL
ncbi:MAG TPA: M48 family metallopeptidase [Gammaproteobacteria bacterium]|nr:M48 family metallopeptidase [Gammaproteobacteria bacterium]